MWSRLGRGVCKQKLFQAVLSMGFYFLDRCVRILVCCVEQNASSHGFRTCRKHAPRRRQDPRCCEFFKLARVGSRRSRASLHQHWFGFFRFSKTSTPRLPDKCTGRVRRCAIGAVGSFLLCCETRAGGLRGFDEKPPSIRTTRTSVEWCVAPARPPSVKEGGSAGRS